MKKKIIAFVLVIALAVVALVPKQYASSSQIMNVYVGVHTLIYTVKPGECVMILKINSVKAWVVTPNGEIGWTKAWKLYNKCGGL